MTAANAEPQEVLRSEILADARRQADRTVARARRDAEEAVAKGREEAEKDHRQRLDAGRAEAARRRDLLLATVPVDVARMRAARVEQILTALRDEAARRLRAREGFDYRQAVAVLAAEAVRRMDGETFVLELSDADREAFGAGLAEEVGRRVGRSGLALSVARAGVAIDGGVIVRDAEGRQMWDDRLLVRLDRLWPAMRRDIGLGTGLVAEGPPAGRTGPAPAGAGGAGPARKES